MAVTPEGCVHYLVAVNETETSKHGFYTALSMMDRQRDTLALICVLPSDDREAARAAARGVLRPVAKIAKESGVKNVAMVASISSHPGLAICNYCLEQSIDVLCLGAADAPKPTSNHDFSTSISLLRRARALLCRCGAIASARLTDWCFFILPATFARNMASTTHVGG